MWSPLRVTSLLFVVALSQREQGQNVCGGFRCWCSSPRIWLHSINKQNRSRVNT